MNESLIYASILYLTIFRLAVIIVGGISITLGYRLFVKSIFSPPDTTGNANRELAAKVGNVNITFKNAAPGTFFVAFGSVLIISMIMSNQPSVDFTKTQKSQAMDEKTEIVEKTETMKMRGGDENNDKCTECEALESKIKNVARAMNKLAWMYYKKEELDDAKFLSIVAVDLAPQNANVRDTFAEILFKQGNCTEAIKQMQKTVELQEESVNSKRTDKNQQDLEKYQKKLEEYQGCSE